ncbi:transcription elongation factor GreA [Patescibacteria group bacterium]|nr:MAG: transcription elongation factor GreA [Patescibacteria group bacterium]
MSEYVYVTHAGLEKLKTELHELKTVRKREVANRIEKAKELGDLSENAEYADAKDEMSFIEGRIIELEDTINRSKIIEAGGTDVVNIGCTVEIEGGGQKKTYTIVGSSEADPAAGRISNETPLARALLGKKVGDTIEVTLPSGAVTYTVKLIS